MRQEKTVFQYVDKYVFFIWIALMCIGLLSIYSAVYDPKHNSFFDFSQSYGKQLIWMGTSLILLSFILALDYRIWETLAWIIYGINILLLILVLFIGKEINGSHSWFQIGSFGLQPAEFAKFGTALSMSLLLSQRDMNLTLFKNQVLAFGLILLPIVLIILSKETGTALVFTAFIFVLFREGLPGTYLLLGFFALVILVLALLIDKIILISVIASFGAIFTFFSRNKASAIIKSLGFLAITTIAVFSVDYAFNNILQDHQRVRINVLLGKQQDLKGAGYNVHQSLIAIGSGGFSGKGYLEGTQTKFNFVPEQSTDFIFCTIGEEFGFLGTLTILVLFSILIYKIIEISERLPYTFGRVYGYSVASILFFHVMVNVGMTIGLLPVIGIPLPFISYGGSSMWGFTILLATLLRLDSSRKIVLH